MAHEIPNALARRNTSLAHFLGTHSVHELPPELPPRPARRHRADVPERATDDGGESAPDRLEAAYSAVFTMHASGTESCGFDGTDHAAIVIGSNEQYPTVSSTPADCSTLGSGGRYSPADGGPRSESKETSLAWLDDPGGSLGFVPHACCHPLGLGTCNGLARSGRVRRCRTRVLVLDRDGGTSAHRGGDVALRTSQPRVPAHSMSARGRRASVTKRSGN